MIFTITNIEKKRAQEESKTIYPLVATQAPELFKVLVAYFERTAPRNLLAKLYNILESGTGSNDPELLRIVFEQMSEVAAEEVTLAESLYSTGEIARLFGVSITTIHNWIEAGRFVGIEKGERFKQVRFPESTLWISPTGDRITVKEVARAYNAQYSDRPHTRVDILHAITTDVAYFETKYQGEFTDTLGKRIQDGEDLSIEELRDAREWQYLLRQVSEV